jgi:hypothetical protein
MDWYLNRRGIISDRNCLEKIISELLGILGQRESKPRRIQSAAHPLGVTLGPN